MGAPVIVLLVIVAVLVGGWLLLVIPTYFYITGRFKIHFEPLAGDDLETVVRKALTVEGIDPRWLIDRGFEPIGGYKISSPLKAPSDAAIVIWKLSGENNFLFFTELDELPTQIEFHTPLKDGALTTGSTKLSLMMPPEMGYWRQAFQSLGIPALYERHLEALEYIVQELGQPRDEQPTDPLDMAKSATMFRGVEFLRRQPLWPLRMPYWTIVLLRESRRRFNKTVREQVELFGTNPNG